MDPAEKDRLFLETGIQALPAYLLSRDVYGILSVRGTQLPRLTIGALLLAKVNLAVWSEVSGEQAVLLHVERKLELVRSKWRSAWENKARLEFRSRFGLWQNFLDDYRSDPGDNASAYRHEVRLRVMLELILAELPFLPEEGGELFRLDGLLRTLFEAGEFVWDNSLKPGFPMDVFWFLYGRLKTYS